MVSRALEVERKYAVGADTALPDLGGVPGVVSAEHVAVARLEAVYVDTSDRTLLRARIAMRRRTGGHDAGWHVKLPGTGGRVELHEPIDPADPDRVPPGLERALFSRVRGRPLSPLARIRTERRAVVVEDVDGGRVEVVDDRVTATDVAAGLLRSWREWEAEQVGEPDASAALLARIDTALLAAGATRSTSPAKLAQALGGVPGAPERPGTAGAGLLAALSPRIDDLHAGITSLVLDGDPDGERVHELRKTLRRIRSLLALAAVTGSAGGMLRDRLRELGLPLGAARDPIVAAELADRLLGTLPPGTPGLDAARRRLVDEPRAGLAAATADVVEQLLSAQSAAVYADLDAFVPDGPRSGAGVGRLTREAEREVRRAVRRSRRAGDDLDALHAARRAARRARFVIEELAGARVLRHTKRLERVADRASAVQDALGDHRDLALLREGILAEPHGPDAFARGGMESSARRELHRLLRAARHRIRAFARRA